MENNKSLQQLNYRKETIKKLIEETEKEIFEESNKEPLTFRDAEMYIKNFYLR